MKKAKILVPAMGMMLLSTAAAVSGTMAWFTANRSVQVQTDEFVVEAIDGSLSVVATAGIGTTKDSNIIKMKNVGETATRYRLADASFDINSKQLYTDVPNYNSTGEGIAPVAYSKISTLDAATDNDWKVAGADIYYAATFTLEFTYTFSGDTRDVDLFFDPASVATFNNTPVANAGGTKDSHKGFRMAFVCGSEIFAWAPFYNNEATLKYVKPADATEIAAATCEHTGTYVASGNNQDVITSSDSSLVVTDATNGNTALVNYLGTLTTAANTKTVTCVVWFEGEDENIINDTKFEKVSALLKFYIRTAYSA